MLNSSPPRLVSDLGARLERLESDFHRAYWESQIAATKENEARRAELELELRRVKGDVEIHKALGAALEQDIHDPVVRRQLEVLRLSSTGNQMDDLKRAQIVALSSAIESEFASFRPEVNGRYLNDNQINEILKSSEVEAERRSAWEASKQIGGAVAGRLIELVRLRNEVALDLGFADHYRMALELQELSEDWLFGVMDELEALTDEPFRLWKEGLDEALRDRFGIEAVEPWHYSDPFFQLSPLEGRVDLSPLLGDALAEDLAVRTFAGWDIDLSGVIQRSDLRPRDLKCQHAFCLDVDRGGSDVRILANVVPGEEWVQVLLHESGHAAYDVSIDPKLPYVLRRPSHTFVTEAIAILSGRLLRDPEWLATIARIDQERISALEQELQRTSSIESLLFARWVLVMTHFERELYSDPEQDLDARWWELVERFQLVRAPEERPKAAWAAKIHLATAPVYYHNYLLGEILASQLRRSIETQSGGFVGDAEVGRLLIDRVFRAGNLMRWDALIEEATGEQLSPKAFALDVAG